MVSRSIQQALPPQFAALDDLEHAESAHGPGFCVLAFRHYYLGNQGIRIFIVLEDDRDLGIISWCWVPQLAKLALHRLHVGGSGDQQ